MATAAGKSRSATRLPRRRSKANPSEPMEFVIFEDNSGDFYWEIVAGDGAVLAKSGSFASHDETAHGARRFRDGAASALFDRYSVAVAPIDRLASGDEESAEHWLDDGGSFNGEAVVTWPARP
jgi:uncharacterized protein YegP (UPF0339 family)